MFTTKRTFFVVFVVTTLISFSSYSLHYTTTGSGSWSEPTIWSLDGGTTSCFCVPPNNLSGDTITINHDISATSNLTISNNALFNVNASGSLDATGRRLTITGGAEVNLFGDCTFSRFINGTAAGTSGGTLNIYGAIIHLAGPIDANAGVINISGYMYQTSGNIDIGANGTINFVTGGKFESFNGNINNEGILSICSDCCMQSSGNWTNEATGTVSGTGSAVTTTGNMNNFGSFSPSITWCSVGFDTGMPSPEDCTTSNTTCAYVSLPVELSDFYGTAMEKHNLLAWVTQTEKDCESFLVTKSEDGYLWETIGTVNCVGNSTSANYYEFRDIHVTGGISYYRLQQIDMDGTVHYSQPISISNKSSQKLMTYPNPISSGDQVFIAGIEGAGTLNIRNAAGHLVRSEEISLSTGESAFINSENFSSGLYIVEFNDGDHLKTTKFIIR
ncbi:MAG: T9SS type A sorting domain-containing protein [bacterium]|nr:T9SS type A sorting domain-containing protein [bacterium]